MKPQVEPWDYRSSKASSPGRQTIHCPSPKPLSIAISGPTRSSPVGVEADRPGQEINLETDAGCFLSS